MARVARLNIEGLGVWVSGLSVHCVAANDPA